MIAGIGFTVAIFIANLAFDDPALVYEAKTAILAGSVVSAVAGAATLLAVTRQPKSAET
jgi:NhaA family Na+:H+ antiporter